MVTWPVVVVAFAATLILVVALEARRARVRADRHFARLLQTLDEHLRLISENVLRGVERTSAAREALAPELALTVDFDELLDQLVTKSARLTGAQGAAVRIRGPNGEPCTTSIGVANDVAAVDVLLGTPGAAQYSAMAVDWSYPTDEWRSDAYRSAVAVPIAEEGVVTGVLASYALAPNAFSAHHVRSLQALADDASPALRTARLFADVKRRAVIDSMTGIRNRAGYDLERDREVARARRTGRPLSLVLLGAAPTTPADDGSDATESDFVVRDFAAVLTRVARSTDVLCRRNGVQFAALLPETAREGAGRFCARLRAAAATNALSHVGALSLTSRIVEWLPDESSDSLDARALLTTSLPEPEGVSLGLVDETGRRGDGTRLRTRAADTSPEEGPASTDRLFHGHLVDEVIHAHESAHPLTVLVIGVDDFQSVAERLGGVIGNRVLAELDDRVADHVEGRGSSSRVGADQFAAVLRDATVSDAETLVSALQTSLESWPPSDVGMLRISAGITDLTPRDTAESVLGRARHALWQARQAGDGTIVVARAGSYRPA